MIECENNSFGEDSLKNSLEFCKLPGKLSIFSIINSFAFHICITSNLTWLCDILNNCAITFNDATLWRNSLTIPALIYFFLQVMLRIFMWQKRYFYKYLIFKTRMEKHNKIAITSTFAYFTGCCFSLRTLKSDIVGKKRKPRQHLLTGENWTIFCIQLCNLYIMFNIMTSWGSWLHWVCIVLLSLSFFNLNA